MTENIATGPDANLNYALQILRQGQAAGAVSDDTEIQPGISLHADPDLRVGGEWRSPSGRLLELEVTADGSGQWIGLHLDMGPLDLSEVGILGLACRSTAPSIEALNICIRSGRAEGGFIDCFFPKRLLSHPEPSSHLDALQVSTQKNLPVIAPWRQLVLFLPRHAFRWDLQDLRLFAV